MIVNYICRSVVDVQMRITRSYMKKKCLEKHIKVCGVSYNSELTSITFVVRWQNYSNSSGSGEVEADIFRKDASPER